MWPGGGKVNDHRSHWARGVFVVKILRPKAMTFRNSPDPWDSDRLKMLPAIAGGALKMGGLPSSIDKNFGGNKKHGKP